MTLSVEIVFLEMSPDSELRNKEPPQKFPKELCLFFSCLLVSCVILSYNEYFIYLVPKLFCLVSHISKHFVLELIDKQFKGGVATRREDKDGHLSQMSTA